MPKNTLNINLPYFRTFAIFFILLLTGCGSGGGIAPIQAPGKTVSDLSGTGSTVSSAGCRNTSYQPNFANGTDPISGLPNRLYHWAHFPVTVYITPSSLVSQQRINQVLNGMNWWVTATGSMVTYQVVNSAAQANIVLQFQNAGYTSYGAITSYSVNGNGEMQRAVTTFNMTYLNQVLDISPVAAHEFGHALGIAGHSDNTADVMYPGASTYMLTSLSSRDVNTLLTAYCGIGIPAPSAAKNTSISCLLH